MTRNDSVTRPGLRLGFGIALIVAGIVLFCYISEVLLVFFAAIFLAVFFGGVGRFLEKHTRFSYPGSVALGLVALLHLFIFAGFLIGPAIADQSTNLADSLPKAKMQLSQQLNSTVWGSHVLDAVKHAWEASKDSNWQSALKFAGVTVHGFGGMIFAVVIGIFLAFQPDLYRNGFLKLFPALRRKRIGAILDELGFTLWWWLMGQLITMASFGIFIGTGLALLGVPLAGTLGLIAALLAFIPSLGILIAVVPAVLLGLTISPAMGLWVCLLYFGVQVLEANVITPLVQRKAILLPPAFVLGSELVMGLLLGGAGLAFATPLCAVILVLVNMLYIEDVMHEHGELPSKGRRKEAKA